MISKKNLDERPPLTKSEAKIRKILLTDNNEKYFVCYDLILVIRKISDKNNGEKHDFEGHLKLILTYYPKSEIKDGLFLNFIGEIHYLEINSNKVENFNFQNYRLNLDLSLLQLGENKIKILYSRDYNHNGIGLNHYIDVSDNKEYLYTHFEPYECHRLFPCFDQPDIRAILKLKVLAPKD